MPQSEVIPAIKPLRMHRVRIADDALWLGTTGPDAKTLLGWNTLRLIAVTKTRERNRSGTGRQARQSAGFGEEARLKVTTYTEDYAEYLADVFAVQPDGQMLGAAALFTEIELCRSPGLIAPDALVAANARTDGFRLLISTIAARATEAHVPPESLALLTKSARKASARRSPHWTTSTASIAGSCNDCVFNFDKNGIALPCFTT